MPCCAPGQQRHRRGDNGARDLYPAGLCELEGVLCRGSDPRLRQGRPGGGRIHGERRRQPAFFREMARQGVTAQMIPVMKLLSITESELPALMRSNGETGNYVAWNYLHAFDTGKTGSSLRPGGPLTGQPRAITI